MSSSYFPSKPNIFTLTFPFCLMVLDNSVRLFMVKVNLLFSGQKRSILHRNQ